MLFKNLIGISQNTVGLLTYDENQTFEGYTLLYPFNQPNVYLINNCGEVVHQWEDSDDFVPGNSVYLLENGNLLKTKRPKGFVPESFTAGGSGGIIELLDWENNVLWSKTILDSLNRAHHDVSVLPNQNILVLAWERKTIEEAIAAGRDTSLNNGQEIWIDYLVEYNPLNDSLVWEWHAWDHLVQDYDSTKSNYGVVDNPGRIDINYITDFSGRPDWMHTNSIEYNARLDQILLSVAFFEEIWIIDHSTTIDEAGSSLGGGSNKGGDLLYRWGNPVTFNAGTVNNQKLFFQHNAEWLYNNDSTDVKISVFNNRIDGTYSAGCVLSPSFSEVTGQYDRLDGTYLPSDFEYCEVHPDTLLGFSSNMSSYQILDNGNRLFCAAQNGYLYELGEDGIVWSYKVPFKNGLQVPQYQELNQGDNVVFRALKYGIDFPAFQNKHLEPVGYLELNPDDEFCSKTSYRIEAAANSTVNLFPMPLIGDRILNVYVDSEQSIFNYEVRNIHGSIVKKGRVYNQGQINLSNLLSGFYTLSLNRFTHKLFLK